LSLDKIIAAFDNTLNVVGSSIEDSGDFRIFVSTLITILWLLLLLPMLLSLPQYLFACLLFVTWTNN